VTVRSALCVALLALTQFICAAELTIPPSLQVVIDDGDVIDADTEQRITALLIRLREQTTAEVKVVTISSTGDEDIFTWCQRHFDLWKLGQQGKDNGAIIALAVSDRKVRIHTGYGLEGILPDSWTGSLSRQVANDFFKAKQFAAGLEAIVKAVAHEIAADTNVDLGIPTGARYRPKAGDLPISLIQLIVIVILIVLMSSRRRRRRGWFGTYGGFGGGGGSIFGGGGGRGGGGFGGFSGGGGRSGGGGGGASW
jgi:uncharacterized protein